MVVASTGQLCAHAHCACRHLAIVYLLATFCTSATAQVPGAVILRAPEGGAPASQQLLPVDYVLNRYGTAVFRDIPLDQAVYSLSQQWQVGITSDSEITGRATGIFRRATLREILDAVLNENGYEYRKLDASIRIIKRELPIAPQPVATSPVAISPVATSPSATPPIATSPIAAPLVPSVPVASFPVASVPVASVPVLPAESAPVPLGVVDEVNRTMDAVVETPDSVSSMAPLSRPVVSQPFEVDQVEMLKLRPQYISVTELSTAISQSLGEQNNITSLDGDQVLLVAGTSETLARAKQIMTELDIPRAQAQLCAYMYEINFADLHRLTTSWQSALDVQAIEESKVDAATLENSKSTKSYFITTIVPENWTLSAIAAEINKSGTATQLSQHDTTVKQRQLCTFYSQGRLAEGNDKEAAAGKPVTINLDLHPNLNSVNRLEVEIASDVSFANPPDTNQPAALRSQTKLVIASGQVFLVAFHRPASPDGRPALGLGAWKKLFKANEQSPKHDCVLCVVTGYATELKSESELGAVEQTSAVDATTIPSSSRKQYRPTVYRSSNYRTSGGEYRPSVYR
jgi:hypothetical protein